MSGERQFWSYQGKDKWGRLDGEVSISISADGVLFEVEEEKAVESYNEFFNCACFVPWGQVDELIAKLIAARDGRGTKP